MGPGDRKLAGRVLGAPQLFAVAVDPDGKLIALGGGLPPIVIQPLDGGPRLVLRGHRGIVNDVMFSPDGKHLASGSDDGTVRIWNTATGKLERTLNGHGQSVDSVAYSPDGRRIVSAGADATVRIWDVSGGSPLILRGHEGPMASAAFDPTGTRVVSAGEGRHGADLERGRRQDPGGALSLRGHGVLRRVQRRRPACGEHGDPGTVRVSSCEVCGSLDSILGLARTRVARQLSAAERQLLLPKDG